MRREGFIHPTAVIGEPPQDRYFDGVERRASVHPTATVEAYVTIDAGTKRCTYVNAYSWIMKGCHIGHDVVIGKRCELAPLCSVGGHVTIGDDVRVGQGATFKPFVKVGDGARIGMGAVVIRDVPADEIWAGNPARKIR